MREEKGHQSGSDEEDGKDNGSDEEKLLKAAAGKACAIRTLAAEAGAKACFRALEKNSNSEEDGEGHLNVGKIRHGVCKGP